MIPILYGSASPLSTMNDFSTLGLGYLTDTIDGVVVEERNGQYELELVYPITGRHYSDIGISSCIKVVPFVGGTPQIFEVYRITKPLNGKVKIYARHISYRLSYNTVMPFSLTNKTATQVLQELKNNAVETCQFDFWTDFTGTASKFKIGEPQSFKSCLGGIDGSVLDHWSGEYEWDNFTVKLHSSRGSDNGVHLAYGKNITDLTQDENIENTVTGIVAFWKGYDEESNEVYTICDPVYSANADQFPFKRTVPHDFSTDFSEQPSVQLLTTTAQNYVVNNKLGEPDVDLEVSFVNLSDTTDYAGLKLLETVNLCDTVHVDFVELGVSATAKVVKTEYEFLKDRYRSVTLGNSTTTNITHTIQAIAQVPAQVEIAKTTTFLESAIARATASIRGSVGGYVKILDTNGDGENDEIVFLDQDSGGDLSLATNVWRWNMGGLGFSSSGYQGPYSAAITADGEIVADFITAGTMSADRIEAGTITSNKFVSSVQNDIANGVSAYNNAPIVNLLPSIYYREYASGTVYTYRGITWTVNPDGSITATGTATGDVVYSLCADEDTYAVPRVCLDPSKKYTLSGCPPTGSASTYRMRIRVFNSEEGYTTYYDTGSGVTTAVNSRVKAHIGIYVYSGYAFPEGGLTFYPMLEVGDTAHAYTSSHNGTGALALSSVSNKRERLIYITKAVGTTSVSAPTAWVDDESGDQNKWTLKRPQYSQSYPVCFIATQRETVDGAFTCTTPRIDDTTTIIDGGNIITGTVTANQIAANTITGDKFVSSVQTNIANGVSAYNNAAIVNLLPSIYYSESANGTSWENNGITWTVNVDGSITATGTATGTSTCSLCSSGDTAAVPRLRLDSSKRYTISGCPPTGSDSTYRLILRAYNSTTSTTDYSAYSDFGSGATSTTGKVRAYVYATIYSGYACPTGGLTFYPMLEVGDTAHEYVSTHSGTGVLLDKANSANSRERLIYISKATGTTSVTAPTAWVDNETGNQNTWTLKRPQYDQSYPVCFVATQRETVDGTYTCTTPRIDETTTVIDGGNIITGSITAGKISVTDLNAFGATIAGWTLDSSYIYKDTTVSGTPYRVALYAPASPTLSQRAMYVRTGSSGSYSYPFGVYYDGTVEGTKCKFTGGTVGGWEMGSTTLQKSSAITSGGTGTQYNCYLQASASSGNSAILVRQRTYDDTGSETSYGSWTNKFRVTYGGKMYATDAEVIGKITATSGSIDGTLVSTGINAANITVGKIQASQINLSGVTLSADNISSGTLSTSVGLTLTSVNSATTSASSSSAYLNIGSNFKMFGTSTYLRFMVGSNYVEFYPGGQSFSGVTCWIVIHSGNYSYGVGYYNGKYGVYDITS